LGRLPVRRWPTYLRGAANVAGRLQGTGVKSTLEVSNYYSDKVVQATMKAVAGYEPKLYPATLLNVMASERPVGDPSLDTRRAWEHLASGAVSVTVPSTDSGQLFVSPHVEVVAEILSHHLGAPSR